MKDTHENNLPLYRIHLIDDMIRSGTYPNKTDLCEKIEVSPRTIARDLDMLRDLYQAPLEFDSHKNGYYYTDENFFIKYVNLKEGELFSLTLFDRLLEQYKNTPLEKQLKSIFKKITESLPEKVQIDSSFLSDEITYISDPLPEINTVIFETVMTALKTSRTLEIEHYNLNTNEKKSRLIDPYHIVCKGGSWYIIAWCHTREEVRIFSLTRITKAEIKNEKFKTPKDFKVSDYIDPGFGIFASEKKPYSIKFLCKGKLAQVAREYKWHPNQIETDNGDGTITVSFETTQLTTAHRLLVNLGSNAIVLEPPELKELVIGTAQRILDNYKS